MAYAEVWGFKIDPSKWKKNNNPMSVPLTKRKPIDKEDARVIQTNSLVPKKHQMGVEKDTFGKAPLLKSRSERFSSSSSEEEETPCKPMKHINAGQMQVINVNVSAKLLS